MRRSQVMSRPLAEVFPKRPLKPVKPEPVKATPTKKKAC